MSQTFDDQESVVYSFQQKDFPTLTLKEFPDKWNDIALGGLVDAEKDGLIKLLVLLRGDFNDHTKVLLVEADNGILKRIYGPSIFRDGDRLVLKIGENLFPIAEDKGALKVGELTGSLTVVSEQDATGAAYPTMTATLLSVADSEDIFVIGVRLLKGQSFHEVQKATIKKTSIAKFVAPLPSPTIKMQDLGVGEYEVLEISEQDSLFGGVSYILHLADGRKVYARGNSHILLNSGWQKHPNRPLTLVVSKVTLDGNKYSVDNALRERLPAGLPMRAIEALPVEEEADPQSILTGVPF
jgi:hypothetical protein